MECVDAIVMLLCVLNGKKTWWLIWFGIRDVKMGFNPWANPAHHGSESDWIEKISNFSKVGWSQPISLNP